MSRLAKIAEDIKRQLAAEKLLNELLAEVSDRIPAAKMQEYREAIETLCNR